MKKNKKNFEELNTSEAILKVAIDMIHSGDIDKITTRTIATRANVNIGAINYHFNSKDNLIDEAFNIILTEIRDSYSMLEDKRIPVKKRLRLFLIAACKNVIAFPEPFKYLCRSKSFIDIHSKTFTSFQTTMMKKVTETISEFTGETDKRRLIILSSNIMGAIIFPNILASNFKALIDLDSISVEERIDIFLEHIK